MAPIYCLSPSNPDITGIGVRTSLYVQALLIVIISGIARYRQQAPDFVASLWRVQFYTIIAFFIAGIVQRTTGELSLFHETAALHLGIVTLWSALVGLKLEPILPTSKPTHIANARYGNGVLESYTSHSITTTLLIKVGALGMLIISIFIMVEHCASNPDAPGDYEDITWIFLFGLRLHGASGDNQGSFSLINIGIYILPMAFILPCVVLFWLFNKVAERADRYEWTVSATPCGFFIGYVIFWVEEIVAIETSLKANPGLNTGEEDTWGFGQIIPLILLIPYLEILKSQYDEAHEGLDSGSASQYALTPVEAPQQQPLLPSHNS